MIYTIMQLTNDTINSPYKLQKAVLYSDRDLKTIEGNTNNLRYSVDTILVAGNRNDLK